MRSLDDLLVAIFLASATLHYATAMLIHFSFFSAYLVVCIPAGLYLGRFGYHRSFLCAVILMAAGAAICVPAVWLYSFRLCLVGVFTVGAGIAMLQTTANPWVGLLGPERTATSRFLFVQSFNALGALLSPLAGSVLFGRWTAQAISPMVFPRARLAGMYLAIAVLLLFLSLLVQQSPLGNITSPHAPEVSVWHLLHNRRLLYGIAMVFLYVGTEAALVGHLIPYLSQHYRNGFRPGTAATLLSVYWAVVVIGRICAAQILHRIHTRTLLRGAAFLAFCLIQVSIYSSSPIGGTCLLAIGLCNAVIFPSIFSLSVAGLKADDLPYASSLLSTAMCGGAFVPVLSGVLADRFGVAAAFAIPSLVYASIALCATLFFPSDYHLKRR